MRNILRLPLYQSTNQPSQRKKGIFGVKNTTLNARPLQLDWTVSATLDWPSTAALQSPNLSENTSKEHPTSTPILKTLGVATLFEEKLEKSSGRPGSASLILCLGTVFICIYKVPSWKDAWAMGESQYCATPNDRPSPISPEIGGKHLP